MFDRNFWITRLDIGNAEIPAPIIGVDLLRNKFKILCKQHTELSHDEGY